MCMEAAYTEDTVEEYLEVIKIYKYCFFFINIKILQRGLRTCYAYFTAKCPTNLLSSLKWTVKVTKDIQNSVIYCSNALDS